MTDTQKILSRLEYGEFYEWNLVDIKNKCEEMLKNKDFEQFPKLANSQQSEMESRK